MLPATIPTTDIRSMFHFTRSGSIAALFFFDDSILGRVRDAASFQNNSSAAATSSPNTKEKDLLHLHHHNHNQKQEIDCDGLAAARTLWPILQNSSQSAGMNNNIANPNKNPLSAPDQLDDEETELYLLISDHVNISKQQSKTRASSILTLRDRNKDTNIFSESYLSANRAGGEEGIRLLLSSITPKNLHRFGIFGSLIDSNRMIARLSDDDIDSTNTNNHSNITSPSPSQKQSPRPEQKTSANNINNNNTSKTGPSNAKNDVPFFLGAYLEELRENAVEALGSDVFVHHTSAVLRRIQTVLATSPTATKKTSSVKNFAASDLYNIPSPSFGNNNQNNNNPSTNPYDFLSHSVSGSGASPPHLNSSSSSLSTPIEIAMLTISSEARFRAFSIFFEAGFTFLVLGSSRLASCYFTRASNIISVFLRGANPPSLLDRLRALLSLAFSKFYAGFSLQRCGYGVEAAQEFRRARFALFDADAMCRALMRSYSPTTNNKDIINLQAHHRDNDNKNNNNESNQNNNKNVLSNQRYLSNEVHEQENDDHKSNNIDSGNTKMNFALLGSAQDRRKSVTQERRGSNAHNVKLGEITSPSSDPIDNKNRTNIQNSHDDDDDDDDDKKKQRMKTKKSKSKITTAVNTLDDICASEDGFTALTHVRRVTRSFIRHCMLHEGHACAATVISPLLFHVSSAVESSSIPLFNPNNSSSNNNNNNHKTTMDSSATVASSSIASTNLTSLIAKQQLEICLRSLKVLDEIKDATHDVVVANRENNENDKDRLKHLKNRDHDDESSSSSASASTTTSSSFAQNNNNTEDNNNNLNESQSSEGESSQSKQDRKKINPLANLKNNNNKLFGNTSNNNNNNAYNSSTRDIFLLTETSLTLLLAVCFSPDIGATQEHLRIGAISARSFLFRGVDVATSLIRSCQAALSAMYPKSCANELDADSPWLAQRPMLRPGVYIASVLRFARLARAIFHSLRLLWPEAASDLAHLVIQIEAAQEPVPPHVYGTLKLVNTALMQQRDSVHLVRTTKDVLPPVLPVETSRLSSENDVLLKLLPVIEVLRQTFLDSGAARAMVEVNFFSNGVVAERAAWKSFLESHFGVIVSDGFRFDDYATSQKIRTFHGFETVRVHDVIEARKTSRLLSEKTNQTSTSENFASSSSPNGRHLTNVNNNNNSSNNNNDHRFLLPPFPFSATLRCDVSGEVIPLQLDAADTNTILFYTCKTCGLRVAPSSMTSTFAQDVVNNNNNQQSSSSSSSAAPSQNQNQLQGGLKDLERRICVGKLTASVLCHVGSIVRHCVSVAAAPNTRFTVADIFDIKNDEDVQTVIQKTKKSSSVLQNHHHFFGKSSPGKNNSSSSSPSSYSQKWESDWKVGRMTIWDPVTFLNFECSSPQDAIVSRVLSESYSATANNPYEQILWNPSCGSSPEAEPVVWVMSENNNNKQSSSSSPNSQNMQFADIGLILKQKIDEGNADSVLSANYFEVIRDRVEDPSSDHIHRMVRARTTKSTAPEAIKQSCCVVCGKSLLYSTEDLLEGTTSKKTLVTEENSNNQDTSATLSLFRKKDDNDNNNNQQVASPSLGTPQKILSKDEYLRQSSRKKLLLQQQIISNNISSSPPPETNNNNNNNNNNANDNILLNSSTSSLHSIIFFFRCVICGAVVHKQCGFDHQDKCSSTCYGEDNIISQIIDAETLSARMKKKNAKKLNSGKQIIHRLVLTTEAEEERRKRNEQEENSKKSGLVKDRSGEASTFLPLSMSTTGVLSPQDRNNKNEHEQSNVSSFLENEEDANKKNITLDHHDGKNPSTKTTIPGNSNLNNNNNKNNHHQQTEQKHPLRIVSEYFDIDSLNSLKQEYDRMETAEIAAKRSGETLRKWVENDRKGANANINNSYDLAEGQMAGNKPSRKRASIFSASMSNAAFFVDQYLPQNDDDSNEDAQNEDDDEDEEQTSNNRDRKSIHSTDANIDTACPSLANSKKYTSNDKSKNEKVGINTAASSPAHSYQVSFRGLPFLVDDDEEQCNKSTNVNTNNTVATISPQRHQRRRSSSPQALLNSASRFSSSASASKVLSMTRNQSENRVARSKSEISDVSSATTANSLLTSGTNNNNNYYAISNAVNFIHTDQRLDEVALRILFKEHCNKKSQRIAVTALDKICAHVGLTGGQLIELAARKTTGVVGKNIAELQKLGLPIFSDTMKKKLAGLSSSNALRHNHNNQNDSLGNNKSGQAGLSEMEQLQGLTVVQGSLSYEEFCLVMSLIPQ